MIVPMMDVPLHCVNAAAVEYHVPAKLILSVLQVERGKVGQVVKNQNGTYDLGPMQINTSWLPTLARYGITQQDVRDNPCVNVRVGAWILSKSIAEGKNVLVGIGDYNSHTDHFNRRYYTKVAHSLIKIDGVLEA